MLKKNHINRTGQSKNTLGTNDRILELYDDTLDTNDKIPEIRHVSPLTQKSIVGGGLGGGTQSDIRLKRNINIIGNPLNKVLSLRGVSYEWRREAFPQHDFEEGRQVGVIAQEVEQVFPELVHTNEEGYKSVDYGALVAPLVEAMKEQQRMIEQKDKDIAVLKTLLTETVQEMRQRMEKVEASVEQSQIRIDVEPPQIQIAPLH